jgi:hypothetical protein
VGKDSGPARSSLRRETGGVRADLRPRSSARPVSLRVDVGGHSLADVEFVSIPATTHHGGRQGFRVSTDTLRNLNPVLVKGVRSRGAYAYGYRLERAARIQSAPCSQAAGVTSRGAARTLTWSTRR